MAGYQDEFLQQEMLHKSLFWGNPSYYGVNLQPLYQDASAANFKQVWGGGGGGGLGWRLFVEDWRVCL